MVSNSPVQKEKIDQAMSRLEKLKQEVASIESKYGILDGQFSNICDEALAIVNNARAELQQNGDSFDEKHVEDDVTTPSLPPPHKIPVIDYVADAIETGLDKLGDALIYPFDAIERLHKKVTGSKANK